MIRSILFLLLLSACGREASLPKATGCEFMFSTPDGESHFACKREDSKTCIVIVGEDGTTVDAGCSQ
jgi:hypothetical protein